MPGVRYSVFNPSGESYVPDTEKFAFQQRGQQMSDWLARQALQQQGQQFNAELADRAAGRQFEGNLQTSLQGTYGQRHAGDIDTMRTQGDIESGLLDKRLTGQYGIQGLVNQGQSDIARIGNEPAMGRLGLDQQRLSAELPALQAQGSEAASKAKFMGGIYDSMGGDGSAPGGGSMFTPKDRRDLARGALGLGPSLQDQMFSAAIQSSLGPNGDRSMLPSLMQGLQTGDMSKVPWTSRGNPAAIDELQRASQLVDPLVKGITDDLSQHNWYHSDRMRQSITQKYDQIQSMLTENGFSPGAIEQVLQALRSKATDAYRNSYSAIKPIYGQDTLNAIGAQ
jgi:hypothetical protein